MNLFICTTPMQLILTCRIIEETELLACNVHIFYISPIENKVVINTLNYARKFSEKIDYLVINPKILNIYFFILLKKFFLKKYKSVYIASINSIHIHFILTYIRFYELFTFDDGTANIFSGSTYYVEHEYKSYIYRTLNKVRYSMLGIHYSKSKVKKTSLLHYTIYNGFSNIINNTFYIDFLQKKFDKSINKSLDSKKRKCNVMLGSVYPDLFESEDSSQLYIERCFDYLKNTDKDTYYIPHPRNLLPIKAKGINIIESENIAEFEIKLLLKKYDTIFLYGFMSSCQFNFLSDDRVINYFFYSNKVNDTYKHAMKDSSLIQEFEVINIDY